MADDLVKRATEALDGVTPLAGWLRNPWSKSDSVERGPIPEWLAALLFEAASKIEASSGLIPAMADRIEVLEAQIKGLQRTYDDLYSDALADAKSDAQDFDSDLWIEVRKYLTELHLDWRDYADDGILADQAIEYIRECMNEETLRAEAAEAEVAKLETAHAQMQQTLDRLMQERDRAREALEWVTSQPMVETLRALGRSESAIADAVSEWNERQPDHYVTTLSEAKESTLKEIGNG